MEQNPSWETNSS